MTGTSTEFTQIPVAATSGDKISDETLGSTGIKIQRVKVVLGDYGADGGNVALDNPIPIEQAGTYFISSTANSTSVQLAAGAYFTGTVENILNQQAISLLLVCDQPVTVTVNQFIDAGGTQLASSWVYSNLANAPFSRSLIANGNYAQIVVHNTGASATTLLRLDTAYGTLPAATQLGNTPVEINAINGVAIANGTVPVSTDGSPGTGGGALVGTGATGTVGWLATAAYYLNAISTKLAASIAVTFSGQTVGLVAGTAKVGQVAIDQTTPNTTNLVVQRSAFATPAAPSASTITTGGTAQTLFSANSAGQNYEVSNPFSATEILYISDGGTASATALPLLPGGYYASESKTINAISIYAATTGHAFYARSW